MYEKHDNAMDIISKIKFSTREIANDFLDELKGHAIDNHGYLYPNQIPGHAGYVIGQNSQTYCTYRDLADAYINYDGDAYKIVFKNGLSNVNVKEAEKEIKVIDIIKSKRFHTYIEARTSLDNLKYEINKYGEITGETVCSEFGIPFKSDTVTVYIPCTADEFEGAEVAKSDFRGCFFEYWDGISTNSYKISIPEKEETKSKDKSSKIKTKTESKAANDIHMTVTKDGLQFLGDVIAKNPNRVFHITMV